MTTINTSAHKKGCIFSFFSGAGFLDLGFETEEYKVDFVNEVHKPFLDAYEYSRKKLKFENPEFGYHLTDISIYLSGKPKQHLQEWVNKSRKKYGLVGFIGGPPCPDFSVGGKNQGFKGENGRLSATYNSLICSQKPDFFLFENVKGLWQTKRHRAFYENMKLKFQKAGYLTTERLINALEYGAAQDRQRIILFGFQRNLLNDLGYGVNGTGCLSKDVFPWESGTKYTADKIFNSCWPKTDKFHENSSIPCPSNVVKDLTVEYWFKHNNVDSHPNTSHCFQPRAGLARFKTVDEGDDSRKSYKRLHRWRYSPTACYGNNEVHLHPYKARRLSVAEAMAIQSLPQKFELPDEMTLTDMFKTVGNGVPYVASNGLARSLSQFLKTA